MTTAEFVNWVMKRTGFQGTPEEVRVLVNVAQNEIFSYNTYFNKKKPEASCILPTTLGILQYTIADTTIRQVPRVYVLDNCDGGYGYGCSAGYSYGYTYGYPVSPLRRQTWEVPTQTTEGMDSDDNVTVYFEKDPGTTTDKYYYDAYTWPHNGQIESLTVPLSIPEKVQTGLLFYMVNEMLEVDKDGRSIYNEERKEKLLKDYFTYANQGAKLEPSIPSPLGV